MKRETENDRAIGYLKDIYDITEIPPDVSSRIWSGIQEQKAGYRTRRKGWILAFAVFGCAGVALAMFVFHTSFGKEISVNDIPPPWMARVVETGHDAEVVQNHGKQSATTGLYLENRSTVRTFSTNAIIEIGQHRIKVDKNTSFGIGVITEQKMDFALTKGVVEFNVSKLPHGSTFTIKSGKLTVSVVGTIFTVSKNDFCASVDVAEGRIEAQFADQTVFVSAGEKRAFCDETSPAKTEGDPQPETPRVHKLHKAPFPNGPKSRKGMAIGEGRDSIVQDPDPIDANTILTEEELLIKRAHSLISKNEKKEALEILEQYLKNYPDGLFREEALFNTVRQCYRLKKMKAVIKYSDTFLNTYNRIDYKPTEIRIIRAQALLKLKENPQEILQTLEPVLNQLASLSDSYCSQAMYLYILAAHQAKQNKKAATWAGKYLERFPDGPYADDVLKIRRGKEKKE